MARRLQAHKTIETLWVDLYGLTGVVEGVEKRGNWARLRIGLGEYETFLVVEFDDDRCPEWLVTGATVKVTEEGLMRTDQPQNSRVKAIEHAN